MAEQDPERHDPSGGPSSSLRIRFSSGAGEGAFSGEIAEVALFAEALSDASRAAVVRYLSDKYGLTLR